MVACDSSKFGEVRSINDSALVASFDTLWRSLPTCSHGGQRTRVGSSENARCEIAGRENAGLKMLHTKMWMV